MQSCASGADAYVVKPVKFMEFGDAIKLLGQFWAVLNAPPSGSVQPWPQSSAPS